MEWQSVCDSEKQGSESGLLLLKPAWWGGTRALMKPSAAQTPDVAPLSATGYNGFQISFLRDKSDWG